jgi:hypothetical protein
VAVDVEAEIGTFSAVTGATKLWGGPDFGECGIVATTATTETTPANASARATRRGGARSMATCWDLATGRPVVGSREVETSVDEPIVRLGTVSGTVMRGAVVISDPFRS